MGAETSIPMPEDLWVVDQASISLSPVEDDNAWLQWVEIREEVARALRGCEEVGEFALGLADFKSTDLSKKGTYVFILVDILSSAEAAQQLIKGILAVNLLDASFDIIADEANFHFLSDHRNAALDPQNTDYCSERNGSDVTRHRVPSRPLIFSCSSPKLSVTLHIIAALTPVVR
ncbi:hypothetical protein K440DRAFT_256845 [Wilcoxina mikolae CBS 423.85]|nr:hypothetical protein K440DRAFT_256845 [Wilcoxina mikolae CBS 423.85]